jgi:pyridoxamine 5'-phosphate oxidase family protein
MSVFSDEELSYLLGERRLARIATVGEDGTPHVDPWRVRGVEVRGRAEAVSQPQAVIRIHPERVVTWGIQSDTLGERHTRRVTQRD